MIRRHDDVRCLAKPKLVKALPNSGKVCISITDCRHRGRPIDAGLELPEAVALILLGALGIACPEDNDERLAVGLEFRQHDLRQSVGEECLLFYVCDFRSGLASIFCASILTPG